MTENDRRDLLLKIIDVLLEGKFTEEQHKKIDKLIAKYANYRATQLHDADHPSHKATGDKPSKPPGGEG